MVSVITPCYNSQDYIGACIDSVLNQSYPDWEMIIVDDCSIDNSALIIKKYCSIDYRIKYLKTKVASGSPAMPRNIGIENAQGEYIAFLDSDDLWLPDKLQKQSEFMEKNNYSFVYSDYEKMSWDGKREGRILKMRACSSYWDTLESCSIPCLTVLLDRKLIGETRFKSIPKEDYGFWLEILRKGVTAYNIGEVYALYREVHNSRSSNKLAMIKEQWYVLTRVEGVKKIPLFYFMISFIFRGLLKYLK